MLLIFYIDFRVLLCYYDYNGKEGCNISASGKEKTVPLVYKEDVLTALKDHGYNTTKLRKERLLSEGAIQSLREKKTYFLGKHRKIVSAYGMSAEQLFRILRGQQRTNSPLIFPVRLLTRNVCVS